MAARTSVVAHDARRRGDVALRVMGVFRSLVYFALGFGPVGWFATTQYSSAAATLAWSIPMGAVVMLGTRFVRSLMRRELSSDISAEDMLMERGVVTVSIGRGQMGRVRLKVGGTYVERFARSRDPGEALGVGTAIRVTDVAKDCVTVEAD